MSQKYHYPPDSSSTMASSDDVLRREYSSEAEFFDEMKAFNERCG